MPDFTIRTAVAGDAPALTRTVLAAYGIYADRKLDLPPVAEGIGEDIAAHRAWVAEANGAIIGGLIMALQEDHAHIVNVAVEPIQSGNGVGRALIGEAVRDCKTLGLPEIRLATHAGLPENVSMYEHLGWQVTGRSGNKVFMSRSV